jgi:class 3 adenylate cyclase
METAAFRHSPTGEPTSLLGTLHRLAVEADAVIQECLRSRAPLKAIMAAFLPHLEEWLGASGALVTTRNEHLVEETWSWGDSSVLGGTDLHDSEGRVHRLGSTSTLWVNLRIAGDIVGRMAVVLPGDHSAAEEEARVLALLRTVCAELDVVLATVHIAAHKQRLIVEVEELLADPVFDRGVDNAVGALHREVGIPDLALLYRDEIEPGRIRYRLYRRGLVRHSSDGAPGPCPVLDAALAEKGEALFDPGANLMRHAVGIPDGLETVLSVGLKNEHWLGKVVCAAGDHGFSAFALDVVQIMCEAMCQRLVDFNREGRHLAQFFAAPVIRELLEDAQYHDRYLAPREETVAVLYADINSFTRISEQLLEGPAAIAAFVNRWSRGAVSILWKHGGVFDKLVGDCVIGLFGPPFFRDSPQERAMAALRAAREIAAFTAALEESAPYDRIPLSGVVPGLGVAVGLNLCPMSVGLMGPNQDYTGFSAGMNTTARLQSLAGFRDTLGMDSFCEAIRDPGTEGARFSELLETPVKNVKRPLRYRRITFGA